MRHPENLVDLTNSIPLELFDGKPTSAGLITQTYTDQISFADGTIHKVEFLVTRLHPTAPIVLGLPWLRMHNPVIDWKELCLTFQDRNVRISAALASEIVQPGAEGGTEELGRGVNGEEIHAGTLQSPPEAPQRPPEAPQPPPEVPQQTPEAPLRAPRTRVKLEEVKDEEYEASQPGPHKLFPSDKDLGPDDPILMGINEWLAFANESTEEEVEEILEAGRSTMEKVTPNPAKDSEEAYQKWKSRDTERSSSWPGAKQKVRWRKKRREHGPYPDLPTLDIESLNIPKIPSRSGLTPKGSIRRNNFRRKQLIAGTHVVERKSDPSIQGKPISLIGAAGMDRLLREGTPAYFLHISPTKEESPTEEMLRASDSSATEGVQQPKDPESGDPSSEQGGVVNELDKEESKRQETEELKKSIPVQYQDYLDVFSPGEARTLPPHRPYDIKIETEGDAIPPIGKLYNMSEKELKSLKEYIDEMLGKGFIRSSSSPAGAPVLFAKKKDGTLRLCVDYRALNKITKKNRYPLPLIGTLVDQLRKAKIFTKIDLRAGYNNVRVAQGHEWKTAFRTRYGSFEYLVMPFGLTNAPSAFQFFMNEIFHNMVDVCVVIYLDDILIYSDDEVSHVEHVRKVLERLRANHLHAKPEKCAFHVDTVEYLGVIISPLGVSMDPEKVKAVMDWPKPRTVKELQAFLGFANFYRRFIDNYSGITKVFTKLLRKDSVWNWTPQCSSAFELLKSAFSEAPVLGHYNPDLPVVLECDASDLAIAGILSQLDPETGEIHPIAFHARSMISAELNYDIYDKELLAIVDCFKQWRAYCEGSRHQIQVYSDHNNLQYFTTTKQLTARQARWAELLSGYDFVINYRPGRLGAKPDALTRRSDVYPKKGASRDQVLAGRERVLIPPERLNATILMNEDLLVNRVREAPKDTTIVEALRRIARNEEESLVWEDGLIKRGGRIYVPDIGTLRREVLQSYHDHKLRGHPGEKRTKKLVNQLFFWKGLSKDVNYYVRSCHSCMRAKASRSKPYGNLRPLPIGQRPWSSISLDHITQLPVTAGPEKYDAILVVVCRLTKQAIYVPCHTTDNAEDFANLFITHVFSKHGMPADIVSDRGSLFVSQFWKELCRALGIESRLSTAYHPQTDGQTERVNQAVEAYLRIYCSYDQDDWDLLLPMAEFVYNNTPNTTTGVSPFFANKGYHPKLSITLELVQGAEVNEYASNLKELHAYLQERIQVANEVYAQYANQKRQEAPDWKEGDHVWLNMENVRTRRPMKKLDHKWTGPYSILAKIGSHAYRLDLPGDLHKIHNVFHVDRLKPHFHDKFKRQTSPPPPIFIKGETEHFVEDILDSKPKKGRPEEVEYLVKWEGYSEEFNSWVGWEGMAGSLELLRSWHEKHPRKRQPSQRHWARLIKDAQEDEEDEREDRG
ncbi:hypothetical protein HHX47_DHR2000968 [Lentinula edodes]|nr:hypothetical protein HHX47_DHR2000968 [Lentinula edodes]